MKPQFRSFLSGALCATLVLGLAVSALAISGRMTIEVDPINVQVNGEVFQPTDVNGKDVPVFAYQGTTYAPLRALAEAYGLEVGYDAATNMATVTDPEAPATPDTTANAPDYSDWSAEDEAAYQEWKAMWTFEPKFSGYDTVFHVDTESYNCNHLGTWSEAVQAVETGKQNGYFLRLMDDLRQNYERVTFFLRCEAGDEDGNKLIQWFDPKSF